MRTGFSLFVKGFMAVIANDCLGIFLLIIILIHIRFVWKFRITKARFFVIIIAVWQWGSLASIGLRQRRSI
jgi:hypothetical protein